MRLLIVLVVFLAWPVGVSHAAERCSKAWALGLLKGAAAADKAKAVEEIGTCKNVDELLKYLSNAKVSTRAPGAPRAGDVKHGPLYLDPASWGPLLEKQKARLLERLEALEGCGGFAGCPVDTVRLLLVDIGEYLAKVREERVPEEALRGSRDVFSTKSLCRPVKTTPPTDPGICVAPTTPEAQLAQAIAAALFAMGDEQRKALAERYPDLEKALEAKTMPEALLLLLEHPEKLAQLFTDPDLVSASGVLVAGRPLVVAVDLATLAPPSCSRELPNEMDDALVDQRPNGSLVYRAGEGGTPDVCILTTLIDAAPGDPACDGPAGQRCVRADVKAWVGVAAKADARSCPLSAGGPRPTLERTKTSPPMACGPAQSDVQARASVVARFAAEVLRAFSARFDAGVVVDEAQAIKPGCITIGTTVDKDAWRKHTAMRSARGLRLEGVGSRGLGQELDAALRPHKTVFGAVSRPQEEVPAALVLQGTSRGSAAIPEEVTLRLHSTLPNAPADATFLFRPKSDCALTPVVFEQTLAAAATLKILELFFQVNPSPLPPPAPRKDLLRAPLGLLLAGLPQLTDADETNDTRGAILAGTDIVLLTVGAALVLSSVGARADHSRDGRRESLDRANDLLHAGLWVGGAAVVPRVVSVAW
jgi:hypothetical protein